MSEQTPELPTEAEAAAAAAASVPQSDGSSQPSLPLESAPSATPQPSSDPASSDASAASAVTDPSSTQSADSTADGTQPPATQEPATSQDDSSNDEQTPEQPAVVEQAPEDAEFTHTVELPEQPQKGIDIEVDVATIEHESNVVLFGIEATDAVDSFYGGSVIFRFVHKRNGAPFGTMSAVVVAGPLEAGQRLVVPGIVPQPFLEGDVVAVVMSQQGYGVELPAGITAGIVTA